MLQEEIARLTGRLKFEVDNRPLVAFEKRLGGVMNMLRELSTLANKKFTVKVALDSRSLRSQIERATKTKISLTNVDISQEALAHQGRRIQEYLNKTTINLNNVKVDIGKLVEQKRFIKTMMGQMDLKLPVHLDLMKLERELRSELNAVGKRQKITVEANLNTTQFIIKLRRALKQAEKNIGALKLRIAEPQVRLKVDKQHLIDEIKAALASSEFRIRINARDEDFRNGGRRSGGAGGRNSADRGLSAMAGFARGALPGLGAAFALSKMNDISQKVIAATNSLEAVSGNEANFNSNKNFLNNLSNEQGLNFRDVAPQFSSIYQSASPSIGVKGTQDMFRGIMKYGTVHGLDKEAMKGSMVALSQMFGKDKIQSEEARQQFSERMPNGMALLTKAAFNSGQIKTDSVAAFGDLMQKGKADPKKILPELGKLMEELAMHNNAYAKSLETTRVAQGRMNKSFEDSVMLFSKGGFDKGMASFFTSLSDSMQRAAPLTEAMGKAFDLLVRPVNSLIRILGVIGENWGMFADKLGITKGALAALTTAIGIFMLPFGGFIVALGGAALVLDDFLTYLRGGKSVFGAFLEKTPEAKSAVDGISESISGIVKLMGQWFDKLEPVSKGLKEFSFSDAFVTSLQVLEGVLKRTLDLLTAIDKFSNGDNAGGAKSLSDFAAKNSLYNQVYNRMDHSESPDEPSQGPGFWSGIGDWLSQPASTRQSLAQRFFMDNKMPETYSGTVDRSGGNITTGPITLELTVQAPEGTDPRQWADQFAPHFENLMDGALSKALGNARAQQAERQ